MCDNDIPWDPDYVINEPGPEEQEEYTDPTVEPPPEDY